ncbi:MAG TPA: CoA pyrophosphatase [Solirubrobacteraceae bacterium]
MPGPPDARGRGRLRRAGRAGLSTAGELARELAPLLLTPEAAASLDVHGRTDAAVLVPLYRDPTGAITAVFTKRRDDLRSHAGEISFPGGRQDEGDEDLRATALRETQEEIGLPPEGVTLAGALEPTPTIVTNYRIYPFVGVIEAGFEWVPAAAEVAEVLELRLSDVRDGHGMRRLVRKGVPFRTDTYTIGETLIWGATARIVRTLLDKVEGLL